MKTMTAFAATLAMGMALAPMAANAANIVFNTSGRMTSDIMNESFFLMR